MSQIKRKLFAISAICHQKISLSETGISKSEILIHSKLENPSVRITGIWPFNNGFKFATNIMQHWYIGIHKYIQQHSNYEIID